MGHIFISYSHKDKEYVHKLAEVLQAESFEVWIDDRIDYGTRWPLVIENAIDSCDAFILVASNNSHVSEWVQNELVRAQRLQKQIFPLLLSGNPWVSFESTQYFDVREGNLPSRKFYDNLRNYLNKHLEYLRELFVENWPLYQNAKYGFSMNYPSDGKIIDEREDIVRIDFPVLTGTDLWAKYVMIHCQEDGVLSSPLNEWTPNIDRSHNIDILGLRYLRESGSEGGMQRLEEWVSYSTLHENKIVTISLILRTIAHGAYLPALLPRIDLTAEREMILYILSTFTWFDGKKIRN